MSFLKGYNRNLFFRDVTGGLVVGIVALPLAIAFGVASQVSPVISIYATIVAGFIIAVFSGIRVQIGGPTAACVVIVYNVVVNYGILGLVVATMIAGVMLIAMGVLKLGRMIKLIPDPLTEGFTAGISVDLFVSQVKDFGGLQMGRLPVVFYDKLQMLGSNVIHFSAYALVIGLLTIFINQIAPYVITKKLPGPILAIVITSLVVYYFHLPVHTIGSRFGVIQPVLPHLALRPVSIHEFIALCRPAFAIAVLVSIMSLMSGAVAENATGFYFRSNKELVAVGLANIVCALFGGIPVTGSIARTLTNVENGGNSRIAGIIQSAVLIFILFVFGKWISLIPLAAIAGLLMVMAYNLSKWRNFISILKAFSPDTILMLATFFITLFANITAGLEIGFALAMILFMRKMSDASNVRELTNKFFGDHGIFVEEQMVSYNLSKGVSVFEFSGPLFFGAAYKFKESFGRLAQKPKVIIVRLRNVPVIDSTGISTLLKVKSDLESRGIPLIISEIKYDTMDEKLSEQLLAKMGNENIWGTLGEAIKRSGVILKAGSEDQHRNNDFR